jgi:hypothetical protein
VNLRQQPLLAVFAVALGVVFWWTVSAAQVRAQQGTDPFLDCLCSCACMDAGWACGQNDVNCFHFPDVLTASPECSQPELGACVCRGFGCGRAAVPEGGECAHACQTAFGTPNATTTVSPTPQPTATAATVSFEITGQFERGDTDCSVAMNAADVVTNVRGLGGLSTCDNDDCDRDGDVDDADVDCTARCLFGACPVPPHAPQVSEVLPESASGLSPFSLVSIRVPNLRSGAGQAAGTAGVEDLTAVFVGGQFADIVEVIEPDELLVILPNLPPGTADLVVFQGDLAGLPQPVEIEDLAPIGEHDSLIDTLNLVVEVAELLTSFDLESLYADSATVIRRELEFLAEELPALVTDLQDDPDFSSDLEQLLDGWIDASGLPEALRVAVAELSDVALARLSAPVPRAATTVQARVAGRTVAAVGRATVQIAKAAATSPAAQVTRGTVVLGKVIVAGKVVLVVGGLVAVGGIVVAVTEDTPVLHWIGPDPLGPLDLIEVTGKGFGGFVEPNLVLRRPGSGFTLTMRTSAVAGPNRLVFPVEDDFGLCGEMEAYLELPVIGKRSVSTLPLSVQPIIEDLLTNPTVSGGVLEARVRRIEGCEDRARWLYRQTEGELLERSQALAEVRSDTGLIRQPVPLFVPGEYTLKVELDDGQLGSDAQDLTIASGFTRLRFACGDDREPLQLKILSSDTCFVFPDPFGFKVPEIGAIDYVYETSGDRLVLREELHPESIGLIGEKLGPTNLSAKLRRIDVDPIVVIASGNLPIDVVDVDAPTVDVQLLSPAVVVPGSRVEIEVNVNDDFDVVVIGVIARGDGVEVEDLIKAECCAPSCIHDPERRSTECTKRFSIDVKNSGFEPGAITLEISARDAGNNAAEQELVLPVSAGDIAGSIFNAATQEPVAPDVVQLFDENQMLVRAAAPGDATFSFSDVLGGRYTILVTAAGFSPAQKTVVVTHLQLTEIPIPLEPLPETPGPSRTPTATMGATPPPPTQGPLLLRRVADTTTAVPPGSEQTFSTFFEFAVDGTAVAFTALGGGIGGVYRDEERTGLLAVVDSTQDVPGDTRHRKFRPTFFDLSIDGNMVSFTNTRTEEDVWVADFEADNALTRIDLAKLGAAGSATEELNGKIVELFGVTFEADALAFGATLRSAKTPTPGRTPALDTALYIVNNPLAINEKPIGASVRRVADTMTDIPEGTGKFTEFPPSRTVRSVAFTKGNLVFVGKGTDGQQGVYLYVTDAVPPLRVIADTTTTEIPEGTGMFTEFCGVSIDGEAVAFRGRGSGGQAGIYMTQGGALRRVADTNTRLPGREESFRTFNCVTALEGNIVAFEGDRPGFPVKRGVYAEVNGTIVKVIDADDLLDAKVVQRAGLDDDESLGTGRLVTAVRFTDASSGLYVADLGP